MAGGFFDKVNKGSLNQQKLSGKGVQMPAEKRDKLWDIAIIKWLVKKYSKVPWVNLVGTDCPVVQVVDHNLGAWDVDFATSVGSIVVINNELAGWQFLLPRPVDPIPLTDTDYGIFLFTEDWTATGHTYFQRYDTLSWLPLTLPTHPSNEVKIGLKLLFVKAGQTFLVGTDQYTDTTKVGNFFQADFHLGDKGLNPVLNGTTLEFGHKWCESVDLSSLAWGGSITVPVGKSIFVSADTWLDVTWQRARFDKMFATLPGALAVFQPWDTIFVYPGTYTLNGTIDLQGLAGERIHFFDWAKVNWLPGSAAFYIGWTTQITGDLELTTGMFPTFSIIFNHDNSNAYVELKSITAWNGGWCVASANSWSTNKLFVKRLMDSNSWIGVQLQGTGKLEVNGDISATQPVLKYNTWILKLNKSRIYANTIVSTPITTQDSSWLILDGCAIVNFPASTAPYSIQETGTASTVSIYSTTVASKLQDPDVTLLVNSPLVVDINVV